MALVHTSTMTMCRRCAERMGLQVHEPDRVFPDDKCGSCDGSYNPWSDRAARGFGIVPRCCLEVKRLARYRDAAAVR